MATRSYNTSTGHVVLRTLADAQVPLPITRLAKLAHANRGHTAMLMREAQRDGLVDETRHDRTGYYELTDRGHGYLTGLGPARST